MDKYHGGKVKKYARLRSVFFTLFPKDKKRKFKNCPVEKKIRKWITNLPETYKYYRLVKHECPTTLREHYHGVICFNYAPTWGAIKRMFCSWVHIQKPFQEDGTGKNDPSWCINYCSKKGNIIEGPWENGKRNKPGYRSDINNPTLKVIEEIEQGNTLKQIQAENKAFYFHNEQKVISSFARINTPKKYQPGEKRFIIMYGESGAGKSETADLKFPDAAEMPAPQKGSEKVWWDGFHGQEAVVFDEWGHGRIPYRDCCRLVNYRWFRAKIHHAYVLFNAKIIIVTTTIHPKYWYQTVQDKTELKRRIQEMGELWHFTMTTEESKTFKDYPNFPCNITKMKNFEFEDEYNFST